MNLQLYLLNGLKQADITIDSIQDSDEFLTVEGHMSVFDNKDSDGDVVLKGAFDRFIEHFNEQSKTNQRFLPLLYRHRWDMNVGYVKEMKDDGHGVFVKALIDLSTDAGRYVADLVRRKKVRGFSYHFFDGLGYMRDSIRYLTQLKVDEVTVTPAPANELATVQSFKQRKDRYLAWKNLLLDTLRADFGLSQNEARVMFAEGFKGLDESQDEIMNRILERL